MLCSSPKNQIPTCYHNSQFFLKSLLPYGLICLTGHVILFVLCRFVLPNGPWKDTPNVTAHQVVALLLMIQWTWNGFLGGDDDINDEIHNSSNLPVALRPSSFGTKMAERSMSALWIWDIPVSMLTPDMSNAMDPIMHAHHLGMLLVTFIVLGWLTFGESTVEYPNPVGATLAPIFFGQVELSSIPLQVVDLFHPKKSPAWYQYMLSRPWLVSMNDAFRQLFALLFLVVRGIYFPYIVCTKVIPDFSDALGWALVQEQSKYILPIGIILAFSVVFTLLQLYWGMLVLNQVYKALTGEKGNQTKGKTS